MDSAADTLAGGLPHSEISGSKPARGSPKLFAACHVLHRLLAPRHPPDALAFLGPPQRQPHPEGSGGHRDGWKATTYKSIPMLCRRTPQTEEKAGVRPCLPAPARATMHRCPNSGTDARERAVITTSRCERSGHRRRWRVAPPGSPRRRQVGARRGRRGRGSLLAFGARTGQAASHAAAPEGATAMMVGLGRLERPTSRLSGVRSNQLSYRPVQTTEDRRQTTDPVRGDICPLSSVV